MKKIRLHGRNQRYLLIAGTNARAIKIAKTIHSKPGLGYILLGFVDEDWQGIEAVKTNGFETVSDFKHLKSYLREHVVDEVIIALPLKSMYTQAAKVLAYCEEQGVIIRHHVDMFPVKIARPQRDYLDDIPVITHYPSTVPGMQLAAKRSLDVILSLCMLIGLLPFFALIGLLVKLDSRGPAFYAQERVGLNTRRFKLYKFRTMTDGAEAKQEELECFNEACGPVFKIKNDPRITRLGRFLRKTSIDELPQLFNVLKGDMSLVGPRPSAGAGFQRVQRGLAAPAVQRAAGDHLPVAGERPEQYVIRALDGTGHEVHRHLVFPAGPENSAADDPGCFARFRGCLT